MVRAPCCEKVGLKKGLWTPQEDQILVSYIQKHGHGNWRALPKHAGLLRCGKSCRLRWINYLRPHVKRGNFTQEEEETIIKLHEMLGNRWSAIAAKLPGRTDNEIKNVWNTHLKKRLLQKPTSQSHSSKPRTKRSRSKSSTRTQSSEASSFNNGSEMDHHSANNSACTSSSDGSSVTVGESKRMETSVIGKNEEDTEETVPEIDESFWSEAAMGPANSLTIANELPVHVHYGYSLNFHDGMDFWYDLFLRSDDSPELLEF